MKKKSILIAIIVIALILLIPVPMRLKDGGSIRFQALLYNITKYHKLDSSTENGYVDGIGIEILGIEIFNNIEDSETQTETIERRKLKDIKILNSKSINTKELVKFNGIVYGRSYAMIDYAGNLDNSIGTINFLIDEIYLPELNGETNNEKLLNSKVLEANEKNMVLNINNEAILFEAVVGDKINKVSNNDNKNNGEKSFFGKVIESDATFIIVEPNEDEEERKSSDKISIGLGENNDAIYVVGTNVKITYDGTIMESYPAQVKATKIELKSTENFEIHFYDKHPQSDTKTYKILDKTESDKYDYNIYTYDGQVNILINGEELSLRNALLNNKITMEEIIAKANKDFPNAVSYDDGGSIEYHYDNYTIIKCHTLDGNRDVYIGIPEMRLNTIN